ncbi:uncharacterized protein LOC127170771 isoform X1 [Labeo rohita]|uniref:uncharacterized protein LOC127170771 isoform X1 n=1 Tax=Labeo rohita TaxID=84645 RepID=UPI0021E27724|nr:uncharacterized protein LOC127170771 isoform X1 [Labeo rohita]
MREQYQSAPSLPDAITRHSPSLVLTDDTPPPAAPRDTCVTSDPGSPSAGTGSDQPSVLRVCSISAARAFKRNQSVCQKQERDGAQNNRRQKKRAEHKYAEEIREKRNRRESRPGKSVARRARVTCSEFRQQESESRAQSVAVSLARARGVAVGGMEASERR